MPIGHPLFLSGVITAVVIGGVLSRGTLTPIAFAQTNTSTTQNSQVSDVQTQKLDGQVTKIDGNTMTIKAKDDSVKEVTVPSNVAIQKDTTAAGLSDVKLNDNVTVTYNNSGQVVQLQATSPNATSRTVMAVVALLVVAGLAYALWKVWHKANEAHIKTAVHANM